MPGPAEYSLVDPERVKIPKPPRRPSITPEQAKTWGPLLMGVAAVIGALGTFTAAMAGAFKPDMGENTKALRELTTATRSLQSWVERHEGKHDAEERSEVQRRHEEDANFGRQDKEIDDLKDDVRMLTRYR